MRIVTLAFFAIASTAFGQQVSSAQNRDPRTYSVRWVQHSPEYLTAVKQAYRLAKLQLAAGLADKQFSADEVQAAAGNFADKPPAIILDVDETVLDNSAFQARSVEDGVSFDRTRWSAWVDEAAAPAMPGVVDFIRHAKGQGVEVFLVTNRRDSGRAATIKNLKDVGLDVPESNLLLRNDADGRAGDKVSRRATVADKHRIVLLIGDNIADLCAGVAGSPPAEAKRLAAEKLERFGSGWVMIPNPMYGGWERVEAELRTQRTTKKVEFREIEPIESTTVAVESASDFNVVAQPILNVGEVVVRQCVVVPGPCRCRCGRRRRRR